jgi:hypothetical protein
VTKLVDFSDEGRGGEEAAGCLPLLDRDRSNSYTQGLKSWAAVVRSGVTCHRLVRLRNSIDNLTMLTSHPPIDTATEDPRWRSDPRRVRPPHRGGSYREVVEESQRFTDSIIAIPDPDIENLSVSGHVDFGAVSELRAPKEHIPPNWMADWSSSRVSMKSVDGSRAVPRSAEDSVAAWGQSLAPVPTSRFICFNRGDLVHEKEKLP